VDRYTWDRMKKALLVALVVIVVMTGLPLLVGMGSMSCTECGPGLPGSAPCLPALLAAGAVLLALMAGSRVRPPVGSLPHWLFSRPFERPPQLVLI
jgi:hypothetical protein